ncbi:PQQ-dependent sugar dehydrogenase [Rubrivirga sp.]|uniref:PQQ-dependent sugar dehydrogenase n=1 Tax=Rubrivirga sp. TaxID=1885344 RepID=UPI003B52EB05
MPRSPVLLASLFLAVGACAQPPSSAGPAALATADPIKTVETEAGPVGVFEVEGGLDHPWGIAFLPDGRALVTERAGRLRIVDGTGDAAVVAGTPEVFAEGQGGLLDVALGPDFAETGHVYLTYAKAGPGGAATAVGRGRFEGDVLVGFEEIWVQTPFYRGGNHFGSRIAFTPDGHLLVSTGERFQFDPAQDLGNTLGVVVRLNPDGSVPDDNPFVGDPGARPEIWSYGHRNAQSLGVHPETGDVWEAEFGPRGGDELNRIEPGLNYGWPVVSWGMNYDRSPIPDPPTRPDLTDAVRQWTPVISPSGLTFYTADAFPAWTGSLMLGGLTAQGVVRLEVDGGAVTHEERVDLGERIRDVEQGPDGFVYVLVDDSDGAVWRLEPLASE